jgi:hypothetical protein
MARPPPTPIPFPGPLRVVAFAACEGFYNAATYFIAVLGGLGALLFLSDDWLRGIWSLVVYTLLILAFLRYGDKKRRSRDGFVVSFSRTNTTIICDIFIQTVRAMFLTVLLDLIGNQKINTLFMGKGLNSYEIRLVFVAIVLSFLIGFPMLYGYLAQAADEVASYRASLAE